MNRYPDDLFDGVPRPTTLVTSDQTLGDHQGSVHVLRGGSLRLKGQHNGSLHVESGGQVEMTQGARHNGSLHVDAGASVVIRGKQHGSLHNDGHVEVEPSGRLAGSVDNRGHCRVAGERGGTVSGSRDLQYMETARIKQPVRRGGAGVYQWQD